MKKILWTFAILVTVLGTAVVIGMSTKPAPVAASLKKADLGTIMPKELDSLYISELKDLKFDLTPAVKLYNNIKLRQFWKNTYGIDFIADNEMTKFLDDNSFICGESSRYLSDIPKEAGHKMIDNYIKVHGDVQRHTLMFPGQRTLPTFLLSDNELLTSILIRFRSGQVLDWENGILDNSIPSGIANLVKPEAIRDRNIPNGEWTRLTLAASAPTIYIIAGSKCFNIDGMEIVNNILTKINPPKDPIAVVRVNGGWVELASW